MFRGCKSLLSGFINPWVIDHNPYISEMIYIRGFLLIFSDILYTGLCPATDNDPHFHRTL